MLDIMRKKKEEIEQEISELNDQISEIEEKKEKLEEKAELLGEIIAEVEAEKPENAHSDVAEDCDNPSNEDEAKCGITILR